MSSQPPAAVIEGRVVHKTSNALKITFNEGPGDPIATGVQGAGDGKGAKTAILFGFKNGGAGRHVITLADGSTIGVHSRERQPTLLSRGDDQFATVERGETSTAKDAAGRPILTFTPDPVESTTPDLYRIQVSAADGSHLGELDVIRRIGGWSVMRAIDAATDVWVWWDRAGQPLKTPLLGTRLYLDRAPSPLERDVLLAACADITLGLRPYIKDMD